MNAVLNPLEVDAGVHLLDPRRLDQADTVVREQPFAFLIATGQLPPDCANDLARDFPRYPSAGFFPHEAHDCGPAINRLVDRLISRDFANAIGSRLGLPDLGDYPSLVTICRSLNLRHGTIHTDSRSKIATALLYLNETWPPISEGCLRFLERIDQPEKNWKFSAADLKERGFWTQYMAAYEACLSATSTSEAPWYVVPADDKENARLIVSRIVLDTLEALDMAYPVSSDERRDELLAIRRELAE